MPRHPISSAPETSRLIAEAPLDGLREFIASNQFLQLLDGCDPPSFDATDDSENRKAILTFFRSLATDRVRKFEEEARRITHIAGGREDELLRRMAEASDTSLVRRELRDAIARSLWCYLNARSLFANVERALQVQHFRDNGKLYEGYDLGAPVAASSADIDIDRLSEELTARLQLDEDCVVEAVDLPAADERMRTVMVVVTAGGAFASLKTIEKRERKTLYFRPQDEVLLVLEPRAGSIEVCAPTWTVRRIVAEVFAHAALDHDLSTKPLTRKTYDLSRFRKSLRLPIPPEESDVVTAACLTQVQVTLGSWKQRLGLSVTPDDDIEAFARRVLGSVDGIAHAGLIARLDFHAKYLPSNGAKERTLTFAITGRNRCSLQSEKDPEKRELGFRLLERWGVLSRFADLTVVERGDLLPFLLLLYDHPDDEVPGAFLADHGHDPSRLEQVGHLSRIGVSDVVLLDDEVFGDHAAQVEPAVGGASSLVPSAEVEGDAMATADLARFRLNREIIREEIETALGSLQRRGRSRVISEKLVHMGDVLVCGAFVPAYLVSRLAKDDALEKVDRLIRAETASIRGVVFSPCAPRLPFFGTHVALSLQALLPAGTAQIDPVAVDLACRQARAGADAAETVVFTRHDVGAATLFIPRKPPWSITGEGKVRCVEVLYDAYRQGQPAVKASDLRDRADCSYPRQLFRREWGEIENVYLRSPKRSLWELAV